MRISKGDVAVLHTSDLSLFWHDLCRYKVCAGVRVGWKVPQCVWDECDFHVNWLHVSRIRPTHWRLNDDFDINLRRCRLTRKMRIGVCVCVCTVINKQWVWRLISLPASLVSDVLLRCLETLETKANDGMKHTYRCVCACLAAWNYQIKTHNQ